MNSQEIFKSFSSFVLIKHFSTKELTKKPYIHWLYTEDNYLFLPLNDYNYSLKPYTIAISFIYDNRIGLEELTSLKRSLKISKPEIKIKIIKENSSNKILKQINEIKNIISSVKELFNTIEEIIEEIAEIIDEYFEGEGGNITDIFSKSLECFVLSSGLEKALNEEDAATFRHLIQEANKNLNKLNNILNMNNFINTP